MTSKYGGEDGVKGNCGEVQGSGLYNSWNVVKLTEMGRAEEEDWRGR